MFPAGYDHRNEFEEDILRFELVYETVGSKRWLQTVLIDSPCRRAIQDL